LAPINGQLMVPQRFAIDFYKLDDQYRTWVGNPKKLDSYLTYRQPIIAAAAGTVVRAEDGLPNSTAVPKPPPIPPITQTVGNHVIVEIAPGTYVLYAHMDPGSVKVRVGQKVEKGQELGLIGTSGNSTTPHLHFQLLSTPTFFPSNSLPYVFDQFDLQGWITERLWDDNLGLTPTGKLPFKADPAPGPHQNELPLDRTVVQFTGTG
jgi:murein DD-endopeptidase MepM/ murein hydrolase activator NlpD